MLRMSGYNVWRDLANGKAAGDVRYHFGNPDVLPGDIACIKRQWHHRLIKSLAATGDNPGDTYLSVDGNTQNQKIRQVESAWITSADETVYGDDRPSIGCPPLSGPKYSRAARKAERDRRQPARDMKQCAEGALSS
jgi:hypothetical protein